MKKSKETVYWISSDASPEEHQRYNEIQRKEEVAFEHKQLYRRRIKKFWKILKPILIWLLGILTAILTQYIIKHLNLS